MKPNSTQDALERLEGLLEDFRQQPCNRQALSDRLASAAHIYLLAPTSFFRNVFRCTTGSKTHGIGQARHAGR